MGNIWAKFGAFGTIWTKLSLRPPTNSTEASVYIGIEIDEYDTNGLVQDCSNSIANALELLQSCTKPSICVDDIDTGWVAFQQWSE